MPSQKRRIGTLIGLVFALFLSGCRGAHEASPSPTSPAEASPDLGSTASPTVTWETLAALEGTEWLLMSQYGDAPEEGLSATIEFLPDNYLQGEAGCNSYSAGYVANGSALKIPKLHRTSSDCDVPDSIVQQERAYFEALESVAAYRASDESLEFDDAAGETILVFARKLPPAVDSALGDTEWALRLLHGEELVEGSHITLNLGLEGFDGFAGCNQYGGEYEAAAKGVLITGMVWQTEMECESSDLTNQEQAFVDALRNSASYRLTDGHLEIGSATGETALVFERKVESTLNPDELPGTAWQLVLLDDDAVAEGSTITLAFHNDYRASGHAGCRHYIATYEASSNDLRFPVFAMIEAGCSMEGALIEQDGEYTTILGWASGYRLQEEQLEILTERGERLLFVPVPVSANAGLEGTTWVLAAFIEETDVEGMSAPLSMSTEPLRQTQVTATFENGTVGGLAGCNTYGAAYALKGAVLRVESPESTVMECPDPPGIMEQEQRYLSTVGDVATYHIHYNQLWLETSDGQALVFVAQARNCSLSDAFPAGEAEIIWPTLHEIRPNPAVAGETVEVRGTGGFLYRKNECGEFRNESASDFHLLFDGEPAGSITCYANTCLADVNVPTAATAGGHEVSVEGGSTLELEVKEPDACPARARPRTWLERRWVTSVARTGQERSPRRAVGAPQQAGGGEPAEAGPGRGCGSTGRGVPLGRRPDQ